MNKTTNNNDMIYKSPCGGFKGVYIAPEIEIIVLDNDISLALESNPPDGPDESYNRTPEYYNNSPLA